MMGYILTIQPCHSRFPPSHKAQTNKKNKPTLKTISPRASTKSFNSQVATILKFGLIKNRSRPNSATP